MVCAPMLGAHPIKLTSWNFAMVRFVSAVELSNISLEGRSTLHRIVASTNKLDGDFEVVVPEPERFDLSVPPQGKLVVYVEDMKSVTYLDLAVSDRLDTRRYPKIVATLVELRHLDDNRYFAAGDISFHGTTRREESEVVIRWLDNSTIEVKGELIIDVRDYNVEVPRLITSTIEPDVRIRMRMVLKKISSSAL